MNLQQLTSLATEFRDSAALLRLYGAASEAVAVERCADQVEARLRDWHREPLTLSQAAAENGYSADHLARLIREGRLPNAGRKHRPLVRRCDLPSKGDALGDVAGQEEWLGLREQIVRSVVESETEDDDG